MISREMISREIISGEMISKEMISREVISREIISREMISSTWYLLPSTKLPPLSKDTLTERHAQPGFDPGLTGLGAHCPPSLPLIYQKQE